MAIGLGLFAKVVVAAPAAVPLDLQIAGGPLGAALQLYARQTHQQLLYRSDLVAGLDAPVVRGRYTPDEALRQILAGTAIVVTRPAANVVVLARPPVPPAAPAVRPTSRRPAAAAPEGRAARPPALSDAAPDIIVTGTHIRGSGQGTSPLTIIDRTAIERLGRATIAETLALLPQNFSGTASEQSALTLADGSGSNAGLATGLNLRGLGAGATLVLVNGRRLAGTGRMGDFNDVSSIPSGAVERVEVLLDGASALYGSDAVGGVVNIILRSRYDGLQTRAQVGTVTKGGSQEVQASQLAGHVWATGSALLSYEYYRRTALASGSRTYARSADLRPLGGSDHRQFYSDPGNVFGFDPLAGTFGPAFAIPAGQNGTGLTARAFQPGVVNLENQRLATDLLPDQTRHSVYGRAIQTLGDRLTLSADGRFSRRDFTVRGAGSPAVVVVTPANPFFVSPTGAPADLIAYSFARELGPSQTRGFAETIAASGGADLDLGRSWQVRGYGAFAQQREQNRVSNIVNTGSLSEALGTSGDDPLTAFDATVTGYFNPYGSGAANSRALLDFVGAGYQLLRNRSRVTSYNVDADGPLLTLPGGQVRLAVGANLRHESFVTGGQVFLFANTPTFSPRRVADRIVKAAFAEVRIPLVGRDNAVAGVAGLELSGAARIEHYSDFGTTTNPKVGLSWSPASGVHLRSSYGTSFRAPGLRENQGQPGISATVLSQADGRQTAVLLRSGSNPDLGPEKARSLTVGVDLAPAPGLNASATWFRTRFRQRIGEPALDDFDNALINPALSPFVQRVMPSTNAADLARVTALINDPTSTAAGSFPPAAIGAIVDARFVNTGTTDISGLDLVLAYSFDLGRNHLDLAGTATYLQHYRERLTPTAPTLDTVNRAGKPVHWRGRLSSDWTRGAVGAGATVNLVNAYRDAAARRISAWTTVDVQVRYRPTFATERASTLQLALNIQNAFDRAPPFYDASSGVGYDAANADALGRYVSLQLTKDW